MPRNEIAEMIVQELNFSNQEASAALETVIKELAKRHAKNPEKLVKEILDEMIENQSK